MLEFNFVGLGAGPHTVTLAFTNGTGGNPSRQVTVSADVGYNWIFTYFYISAAQAGTITPVCTMTYNAGTGIQGLFKKWLYTYNQ